MPKAKKGDKVKVHYTGKFKDGSIFDSSLDRSPLEFKIGGGEVIKGFDDAVTGMSIKEKRNVLISPGDAYGEYNKDLAINVDPSEFPENEQPQIGDQLELNGPNGEVLLVTVIDMNDESVTLDANHPLAGQELNFEIELVEIAK